MQKTSVLISWLVIPAHTALLSLIGFVVGLAGLLVTVAGFVIALRQIAAIKTETEATTAAVATMQFKVSSLDIVKECHSAMARISDIRLALKQRQWDSVLTNYEVLIETFLRLAHVAGTSTAKDSGLLIKMTEDMAKICDGLRKITPQSGIDKPPRGQDQALRNFSDIMTRISLQSEKDLRG